MKSKSGLIFAFSVILLASAVILALPAFSYLPELTGTGSPQNNHWDFSAFQVQWNLNTTTTGAKIVGTRTVQQVIQASFATWIAAPNASLQVTQGANSTVTDENASPSNVNLICFICTGAGFTAKDGTLAVTITTTADTVGQADGHGGNAQFVGQIIKSDIIFNPNPSGLCFITSSSAKCSAAGDTAQDLQTVATHEIGHFFGLDHSGVVRSMMYPFAPDVETTLSWDDVAGLSLLYPKTPADVSTGSIKGTITNASGAGVFGAHVFANSTTTANPYVSFPSIRKSPIGTLTVSDGSYTITGVPPDSYQVIAEPLDLPVTDSDVSGYAAAFNRAAVQIGFATRWH
jgi:matrixin/carboxypeptidase family protein